MEKDENTQNKRSKQPAGKTAGRLFSGKGFYIVLSVCVAVIAISAGILARDGADEKTDVDSVKNYTHASVGTLAPKAPDTEKTGTPKADTAQPETETLLPEPDELDRAVETMSIPSPEDESEVIAPRELHFIWPLAGALENAFSGDSLVYSKTMMDWRTHNGVDIAASVGTRVMAIADGTVSALYEDDLFGTVLEIDHGEGLSSVYANLAKVPTVAVGDTVAMGAVIGAVGDTASAETGEVPHLHLAVMKDEAFVDPCDYLPFRP